MPGDKLLYLVSLIAYMFGAITFSVLTLFYWRQRGGGRRKNRGAVFPAFASVCAIAFVLNLLLRIPAAQTDESVWGIALPAALAMATGLLPPLLVHVVVAEEGKGRYALIPFYTVALVASAGHALNDVGLLDFAWAERFDLAPAMVLGASGAVGLAIQYRSGLASAQRRRHRWWTRLLLLLVVLFCAASLTAPGAVVNVGPDYLVLAFFCVTLYYKERLVFFDLILKRAAFFLAGMAGLAVFLLLNPHSLDRLPQGGSQLWVTVLLVVLLWLSAPWMYGRVSQAIDSLCLGRRYSAPEAERAFIGAVQAASTEEELRTRAEVSLQEIFQSRSTVCFSQVDATDLEDGGLAVLLEGRGAPAGAVAVAPRRDSIPFLSDDHRLLRSLAQTLGVVLENVRFRDAQRRQEEREQQLRWLASRAELRALRAQINPHFLFNALNSIAGLIASDPRLADETIEQLAQVFRYTLRKSETEWVRLDEEVEFVMAYLNVERARFGERLHVEVDLPNEAGAVPVPAMTIQPLIENAVKHGISSVERRGVIRLIASLRDGRLTIEVCDNGPGFPSGFAVGDAGHGLRNVAERISGYYGSSAGLRCENTADGACVRLELPAMVAQTCVS